MSLESISKDSAVKEISKIQSRSLETCGGWNKDDGVIGLLCLEDALDNLNQSIGACLLSESADPRTSDLEKTALLRSLGLTFGLLDELLGMILGLGRDNPRQ